MNSSLINEKAEHINNLIRETLAKEPEYGKICEAMHYSVLNGGKRLRAIMLLESFRMFMQDEKAEKMLAEPYICAIEFIHAYSLVHDDLPAMDNDVLRRGKPTTHVAYGHAMGVLTGDALLNYAFETIGNISENEEVFSLGYGNRVLKAFNVLAKKAGFSGMIGGQVLDTTEEYKPGIVIPGYSELNSFDFGDIDPDRIRFSLLTYELKTSQLFEAALMCGAILGGAGEEEVKILEETGRDLGLAFQIEDDILDMTSNSETLGKSVNIDEKNGKDTLARMLGLAKAGELVKMYTSLAINGLNTLGKENKFLLKLFESLIFRKL